VNHESIDTPHWLAFGEITHPNGRPVSLGGRWTFVLILHFTQGGKRSCTESQETFAAALGCSAKVAGRYRQELATLGLIEVKKPRGQRAYEIILPSSVVRGDARPDRKIVPHCDPTDKRSADAVRPPGERAERKPHLARLTPADRRAVEAAEAARELDERISPLIVEHGPVGPRRIAESVGVHVEAVRDSLERMERRGELEEADGGFVAVPGAGAPSRPSTIKCYLAGTPEYRERQKRHRQAVRDYTREVRDWAREQEAAASAEPASGGADGDGRGDAPASESFAASAAERVSGDGGVSASASGEAREPAMVAPAATDEEPEAPQEGEQDPLAAASDEERKPAAPASTPPEADGGAQDLRRLQQIRRAILDGASR
jgi:hypothetical protein